MMNAGAIGRAGRRVALVALTSLLEKNVIKTAAVDAPLVISMSRLIVLAFAAGVLRQIWHAGIAGWPDATLAIAIVLALPILGALEHAKPEDMLDVAKTLIGRIGAGDVRRMTGVYSEPPTKEPSEYDDQPRDE